MDIRNQVKQQLEECVRQGKVAGLQELAVHWPEGHLTAQLRDVQPLGCTLWQLEVRTAQTARAVSAELQAAGQALADRVRYLLEPLQIHEVDRQHDAVQLRSSPPQRDDRKVIYYEVTAERQGSWRLARYEKDPGTPRQQVPAVVTTEVLERLCQDMVDVAMR